MVRFAQQAPHQVIETPLKDGTVTLLVAVPHLAVTAVIVTDPGATPVTGTRRVAEPGVVLRVAGTVATLGLLEVRVTLTRPRLNSALSRILIVMVSAVGIEPTT